MTDRTEIKVAKDFIARAKRNIDEIKTTLQVINDQVDASEVELIVRDLETALAFLKGERLP